jgi:hypothetical protein
MKRVIYTGAVIVVAIVSLSACGAPVQTSGEIGQDSAPAYESVKYILDATISITLHAPNPDNPAEVFSARGLSTVAYYQGEDVLITHDHWGEVLDQLAYARFWSRDNALLLELDGAAYKELIRYRDGGTTVLSVPEGLIADQLPTLNNPAAMPAIVPAALADEADVQVGDKVLAVVRDPKAPHRVEILEAVVESVEDQQGLPSLTLRRENGKPIEPGDSGGGVWYNGRLVGNMWYRVKHRVVSANEDGTTSESLRLTDLSVAASHPLNAAG